MYPIQLRFDCVYCGVSVYRLTNTKSPTCFDCKKLRVKIYQNRRYARQKGIQM